MVENHLYRFNGTFISLSLLIFASFLFFVGNSFAQTPEQVKFYSERIEFGTEDVKRNALFDLRTFKTETASRIALPALKDSSEIIRATATHSVVYLPKDEAAQNLIPLLNDSSEFVRRETAYALGKTKNSAVAKDLIKTLQKDKKQSVKDAAVVSLGLIGNFESVQELFKILQRKPRKKQAFIRRAAVRSIGQLIESMRRYPPTEITPQSFLPQKYKVIKPSYSDTSVADSQLFNYIKYGFTEILTTILRNKKEDQDTRREAAFALGAIGNPSAIQILKDNLNSEDYYLAEICKEALLRIQN